MTLVEEYRAAAAKEQEARNLPLVCDTQDLCGFEVRHITLQDYLTFRMIGSPFFVGGPIQMSDVFAFVWRLHPGYPDDGAMANLKKDFEKFQIPNPPRLRLPLSMLRWTTRSNKAIDGLSKMVEAIHQFVADSLMDFPGSSSEAPRKSYYSEIVSICAMFGREYGWTQHYTMKLKLRLVTQYLKEITQFHGGSQAVLFNPSDQIISRWLASQN